MASNTAAARSRDVVLHGTFDPLPTQLAFASSPYRLKAYIGPMGSGKSEIVCRTTLDILVNLPGSKGVIGRFTLKDFKRTTQETLDRVMPPEIVEHQLANNEGWIVRTVDPDRPSKLLTAHFDETGPYAGMGMAVFAIDEVNGDEISPSVPEEVFNMLDGRLGREQEHDIQPYGLLGGNPAGHNWVWRLFHPESPGRLAEAMMFTPGPYENAVNLIPGYYEGLQRRHGPEWVARYVLGSHNTFIGQIYGELDDRLHAVNPFAIPPSWPRVISMDYGHRNPTCVIFAAVNPDGVVFLYDEHYEAGQLIPYHAAQIKLRLPDMVKASEVTWVADPSIFSESLQHNGKVFRIYDEYADVGLEEWTPGENDKKAGRERIKTLLQSGRLKFFRGCCPNVWREMRQLHWKRTRTIQDRNVPEEEADVDDHGPDALRYLVMSRPDAADKPKEAPKPVTTEDIRRAEAERRKRRVADHLKASISRHQKTFKRDEDDFV